MSDEGHLVFVYGTLRRGASNAFRMEGAEFVRKGVVRGRLFVVSWYPGFVRGGRSGWVEGEVWRVGSRELMALDEFEGEEYRRVRIEVQSRRHEHACQEWEGDEMTAWIWEWEGEVEGLREIKSGDWMDVEHPRPPKVCTCVGCLVLPAIPVGSSMILGFLQSLFGWSGDYLFWIGAGLVTVTPAVSLLLAYWGGRRRERGQGLRETAVGISLVWATASILTVAVWLLILFFGK